MAMLGENIQQLQLRNQFSLCDIYIQKTQVNKVWLYLSMSDTQRT